MTYGSEVRGRARIVADSAGVATSREPDRPTLSMVLIARDEVNNIGPCFGSFWDDVDEVVLVDTGSTDNTLEAARAFAGGRGQPEKLITAGYAWHDDFAAARNFADRLATGDWIGFADLDDVIVDAHLLRALIRDALPRVAGFAFPYEYFPDDPATLLYYNRLWRRGAARWVGRCHEGIELEEGDVRQFVCVLGSSRWRHRSDPADHRGRNLRILRRWVADEPEHPGALALLAVEHAQRGDVAATLEVCREYALRFQSRLRTRTLEAEARECLISDDTRAVEALVSIVAWSAGLSQQERMPGSMTRERKVMRVGSG